MLRAMTRLLPGILICLSAGSIRAETASVSEIFKQVKDSVVVIETTQKAVDDTTAVGLVSVGGLGSGVLVTDDGKIMTAAHVVQTADTIKVHFHSGEEANARVVASLPAADLALLQVEQMPNDYQVADIGDSDQVEVGDRVFVIGAPFGITHTLTVGHISARREQPSVLGGLQKTEVFQTDTAINKGNSGGPMFNLQGQVIGIVSYIISESGGFEGLGFVVTSNMARRALLEERSLWSGFQGQMLAGDLAKIFNVPQERALLVEHVADPSPAIHMGLMGGSVKATIADFELVIGGDIILEALGVSLASVDAPDRIHSRAGALEPDDTILLKVLRHGKIVELRSTFLPNVFYPPSPPKPAGGP